MSIRTLVYAYVLGGLTFIPAVIFALIFFTIYTSVPIGDPDPSKETRNKLERQTLDEDERQESSLLNTDTNASTATAAASLVLTDDIPKTRKGWLTMRPTFEELSGDGSYVTLVRSFLDARSKDPKKSRPKDMWYVVLKGKVLYLFEDESMGECEVAFEMGGYEVVIWPEDLQDGELFAKRNAICIRPKKKEISERSDEKEINRKEKELGQVDGTAKTTKTAGSREKLSSDEDKGRSGEWYIFSRLTCEMEDWYLSLIHASDQPANSSMLAPLEGIFRPIDMNHLVTILDEEPDIIPMRWLNAIIGRVFFSFYKTDILESYIISRLMKKISKVKRPAFLTDIVVTEVNVGNTAPRLSKPMLKELTKEGDASLEVKVHYKGEVRITIEATATINIGARFGSYTVRLVLAAVLRELEGNLLVKIKRPPSNRIWYAFTQSPKMVINVEPIVSDRQITWSMILNTIESKVKEVIEESVVMPNMDDISFFESAGFSHRGGIWPDASRQTKAPVVLAEPSLSVPATNTSVTASAPHLPATTDSPMLPTTSVDPKSRSSEDLPTESTAPTTTTADVELTPLPPPEPAHILRASSEEPSSSNRTKRRTWFGGLGVQPPPGGLVFEEPNSEAEERRGRTHQRGSNSSTPSKVSSQLPSVDGSVAVSEFSAIALEATPSLDSQFTASTKSRSSSSESSGKERSPSPTPGETRSSPPASKSTSAAQSFLSTLKTRAGDKQALSNTAKETLRKWSAPWTSLKKEGSGGSEVTPDHGKVEATKNRPKSPPLGSKNEIQPSSANKGHIARASYAEVRAAVAERRGKAEGRNRDGSPGLLEASAPMANGSANGYAVTANDGNTRERKQSISSTGATSVAHVGLGRVASPSRRDRSDSMDYGFPRVTRRLSAAAPSVMSPSIPPQDSQPSTISALAPQPPEPEQKPAQLTPSKPIHTQPSPKTMGMTIPGIHASHKGDVMSMGYVAPSPPAPESKLKTPSIPSSFRLWKSPNLVGQQPGASTATSTSQTTSTAASASSLSLDMPLRQEAGKVDQDVVPLTLPPNANLGSSDTDIASSSQNGGVSAADVLKSIAERDETKRAGTLEVSVSRRGSLQSSEPARDGGSGNSVRDHDGEKSGVERSNSLDSNHGGVGPPALVEAAT